MESNQIRYFLALCEERSFSRAARRCGVSQPSVSNAIRRLEEEFGGNLFDRNRGGTTLSPLGAAVRPYLDQINQCAEAAKRRATDVGADGVVSSHRTTEQSMRRIFYGSTFAAGVFLVLVLVFHQLYPATASHIMANDVMNVRALAATIDVNALPRQDVAPEIYQ